MVWVSRHSTPQYYVMRLHHCQRNSEQRIAAWQQSGWPDSLLHDITLKQ